jgi:hypothetical protein
MPTISAPTSQQQSIQQQFQQAVNRSQGQSVASPFGGGIQYNPGGSSQIIFPTPTGGGSGGGYQGPTPTPTSTSNPAQLPQSSLATPTPAATSNMNQANIIAAQSLASQQNIDVQQAYNLITNYPESQRQGVLNGQKQVQEYYQHELEKVKSGEIKSYTLPSGVRVDSSNVSKYLPSAQTSTSTIPQEKITKTLEPYSTSPYAAYRNVYRDSQGRIVGEEKNVLQASNAENLTWKESIPFISPSGDYNFILYAGQQARKGLQQIPGFTEAEHKLGLDKPVQVLNQVVPGVPAGNILVGAVTTAPVAFAFGPALKTGVEDLQINKISNGEVRNSYKEVQAQVINQQGEIVNVGKYQITTRVSSPAYEITTGKEKLMGFEPTIAKLGAEKVYITKTPFISQVNEPINVLEAGPRQKSISKIGGISGPLNVPELYPGKLNPIDRMLVKELSGPVPGEMVLKMFDKDTNFLSGELIKDTIFKGAKGKEFTLESLKKGIQSEGTRTTSARYLAEFKELQTKPEFTFELYTGKVAFKDITKPYARAAGNLRSMEGVTAVLKEPINPENLARLDIDKMFSKMDTIDLKANLPTKQISRQVNLAPKAIPPRVKPINLKNFNVKPTLTSEVFKPAQSVYFGSAYGEMISKKHLVEAVNLKSSNVYMPGISDLNINKEAGISEPRAKSNTISISRLIPEEKFMELGKESSALINKELSKEITKEINKNLSKETTIEINKSVNIEKLMSKQMQKEMTKLVYKQVAKQQQKNMNFPATHGRFYRGAFPKLSSSEPIRFKKKAGRGFDVFRIRNRKPELVARGLGLASAEDVQVETALKDLTATTFLRKSDIPARDISTGQEFARFGYKFRRPVEKSLYKDLGINVIIQKSTDKGGRLSTKGEKAEIQKARRRKMEKYLQ